MTEKPLTTQFAPAERASREDLERQRGIFDGLILLRAGLDAVPDMVLILNSQRQIVFANKALLAAFSLEASATYLGRRFGELIGCSHSGETKGGCGTTKFCRVCGAVKAVLAGLAGKDSVEECRIMGKEPGVAHDLRVWAAPFEQEGQRFVIYSIKDISQEKRLAALERIFFHDVLNTAGGIKGLAEILVELTGEDAESCRRMMVVSSGRLIDEINSQRDLTAAERGDLQLRPSEVDARELVENIAALYRSHDAAKEKKVEVVGGDVKPMLKTDRVLLSRVVSNMVKNALEAAPKGSSVTVGCAREGGSVVFRVRNPGLMPEEVRLQMFQRSFSTKGTGRGLGTYSMKLLGERYLKGEVGFVSSDEERATTFFGKFPPSI